MRSAADPTDVKNDHHNNKITLKIEFYENIKSLNKNVVCKIILTNLENY